MITVTTNLILSLQRIRMLALSFLSFLSFSLSLSLPLSLSLSLLRSPTFLISITYPACLSPRLFSIYFFTGVELPFIFLVTVVFTGFVAAINGPNVRSVLQVKNNGKKLDSLFHFFSLFNFRFFCFWRDFRIIF